MEEKAVHSVRVLSNMETVKGHYLMTLAVPPSFTGAVPGQFIMVRIAGRDTPFLPRPFSIHSLSSQNGETVMEVLYRTVGAGTAAMATLAAGDRLALTGPLGRGYRLMPERKQVVLLAGGMGVAPLAFLAERLGNGDAGEGCRMTCYLGARTASLLHGLEKLERTCDEVKACTDDGSRGHAGLLTELFRREMDGYAPEDTIIYACGPREMMKELARLLAGTALDCQVSLEERMACGIGACLGCAVEVRTAAGGSTYKRVCADGPVFDIGDILWGE
ncbi:MAG: dihydroorotate dehydrogenase electron transfer subunit [Deltaproteobacteria bacterium]|nr:dihydroorotate dehydrogenase electron transfer subunit [Deltaproteobacteria bacterium]